MARLSPIAASEWQWRNPTPQGQHLNGLTFGNGRFVAVGRMGAALISTNGSNWVLANIGTKQEMYAAAYGNGVFVAVGLHDIWASADGRFWAGGKLSDSVLYGVAFLQGQFWAVGANGTILVSPDGLTWSRKDTGGGLDLVAITYGNNRFVAVGWRGAILTSSDGDTWSERISGTSSHLTGVAYGVGRFIATTAVNDFLISTNGLAWTRLTNWGSRDNRIDDVSFEQGQFVALGISGGIYTSTNGNSWTMRQSGVVQSLSTVRYGQGSFVAVGEGGCIVVSPDAMVWRSSSTNTAPGTLRRVTWADGAFYATGDGGTVLVSKDGRAWAKEDFGSTSAVDKLRYLSGKFLAYGNETFVRLQGTDIYGSADAVTWASTLKTDERLLGVYYEKNTFVVIGAGSTSTSADGVRWTRRNTPTAGMTDVAFGNDLFLAVGEQGGVSTSPDGITWSKRESGIKEWFRAVGFGNGKFVATAFSGFYQALFATSSDGTRWDVELPTVSWPINDIIGGSDSYVAVGDQGTIIQRYYPPVSYDNWKAQTFSPDEQNQPLVSGRTADPDRDGISNLLEYALDLNPQLPPSNPMAYAAIVEQGNERYLAMTCTAQERASDVRYSVRLSNDLIHWGISGENVTVITNDFGGVRHLTFRDGIPASKAPTRFMRLQIIGQ